MLFTKDDVKQIKKVFSFVKKIKTIDVLRHLMIVPDGKQVIVHGTNLEIYVELKLFKTPDNPVPFLIPYSVFEKEAVEVEFSDKFLKIKSGIGEKQVPLLSVDDYPKPDKGKMVYLTSFSQKDMEQVYKVISFSGQGKDPLREILDFVKLTSKDGVCEVACTDGHMMGVNRFKNNDNFTALIHPCMLAEEDINVYSNEEWIETSYSNIKLTKKQYNHAFPNYERFIQADEVEKYNKTFEVVVGQLKQALSVFPASKVAKTKSGPRYTNVIYDINSVAGTLQLSYENEGQVYKTSITCNGEPLKTSFNKEYMLRILEELEDNDTVEFRYKEAGSAFYVYKNDLILLIMPVRISEDS